MIVPGPYTRMPAPVFGIIAVPPAFVPMKLPCTTVPVAFMSISRPLLALPEMTLPAPADVPPISVAVARVDDDARPVIDARGTGCVGTDEVALDDVARHGAAERPDVAGDR